ncbi:hypothetical protein DPMN_133940 [Dreissena polymorpha]|uniref:Uncharacterized protein n=1 Tax=Dreissena polymorpha TaxID=45954 RepID=A0A9D4FZ81_DREPO|nr:hypothetical protein DPMN_133940 [Dreissena polymorpha]
MGVKEKGEHVKKRERVREVRKSEKVKRRLNSGIGGRRYKREQVGGKARVRRTYLKW